MLLPVGQALRIPPTTFSFPANWVTGWLTEANRLTVLPPSRSTLALSGASTHLPAFVVLITQCISQPFWVLCTLSKSTSFPFVVMAAVPELPYEVQQYEARKRAMFKASNGYSATKYLTPDFLKHFPVVMESTEAEEHLSWNEVSGLFRRRDAIPATFIDQSLLVEQIDLDVFGKRDMEVAERRALALFKLTTKEGDRYALMVVYIPYQQKRMAIQLVLPA